MLLSRILSTSGLLAGLTIPVPISTTAKSSGLNINKFIYIALLR